MAAVNIQVIEGAWKKGIALDVHTLSSTPVGVNASGHTIWDTKRSELGELLYRLKYNGDKSVIPEIVSTAVTVLKPSRAKFDVLVPVPPSQARAVQPVIELANGIGASLKLPVMDCISATREKTALKSVTDQDKRKELLAGLFKCDPKLTGGKNILLFDDLFRSGATLNAITEVLMGEGKAAAVRVVAITRTRSNR